MTDNTPEYREAPAASAAPMMGAGPESKPNPKELLLTSLNTWRPFSQNSNPHPEKLDDLNRRLKRLRRHRESSQGEARRQRTSRSGGRPSELREEQIREFVHMAKLVLELKGLARNTRMALYNAILWLQSEVPMYKTIKTGTLRDYCYSKGYWESPVPTTPRLAERVLGQDKLQAALRDHGPLGPKEIQKILGISYKAAVSLTLKEKRADRIVAIGHGKFDLPKAGAKAWVRANALIVQVLIDAPGHQMRECTLGDALVALGRSPHISMQLTTLRRNGLIDPPRGGLVKLSSAALAMIARRKTIRDGRGRVLWAPEMKRSLPSFRKVVYTDKASLEEMILAALLDGSKSTQELAAMTGKSHSSITSKTYEMRKAGTIILVGHGKWALADLGTEEWVPVSQIIIEVLVGAPSHEMKYSALTAAVVTAGRSSHIASQLSTLRKNNVLARADGGPVRLRSAALDKIKRGESIHDPRGGVLWKPRGG